MKWLVEIGDEFEPEIDALPEDEQTEILASSRLLQEFGPRLGRPRFAFDTKRKAILLVAGDKSGHGERRFYRELIREAEERFDALLSRLKGKGM